MNILIVNEYAKEALLHQMRSVQGLSCRSLQSLFSAETEVSSVRQSLELQKILLQQADEFRTYREMFAFPAFIDEVLQTARSFSLWQIHPEDLPASTEAEKERSALLKAAMKMPLAEKQTAEQLPETMRQLCENNTLTFAPSFETDVFWHRVRRDLMKMCSAAEKKEPLPEKTEFRHAVSLRQEIEAAALRIIAEGMPCNIILCDPSASVSLVHQVFRRYRIPYSCAVDAPESRIPVLFDAMIDFALTPDAEHLLTLIEKDGFAVSCSQQLKSFLRQTMTETRAPDIVSDFTASMAMTDARKDDPAHESREVRTYRKLQAEAEEYFEAIGEDLSLLQNYGSMKELVMHAYSVLSVHPLLSDSNHRAAGMAVYKLLNSCLDMIQTEQDVRFVSACVRSLQGSGHSYSTDFCTVTDLHHPVSAKPLSIVIGADGRSYPGFAAAEGLYDEDYLSRLKGYPSLAERQNSYMEQLQWIMHSGRNTLVFSYHTNDSSGRQVLPAYEVTSLQSIGPDMPWPLIRNRNAYYPEHVLSQETSKALFTREEDENIVGSVSSVETWFQCPYRYYVQSGLHIRSPQFLELNASSTGTIQHGFLENTVKVHDKTCLADISEEDISEKIDAWFRAMEAAWPNQKTRIALSRRRMTDSLKTSIDLLNEYENATMFEAEALEKHFEEYAISPHVRLRGTIDRISRDPGNHMIQIIDYKSSVHKLIKSKVYAGLSLQLLSYLMTAMDLYPEDEPAGAYYFSMKEEYISEKTDVRAASQTRNQYIPNDLRNDPEALKAAVWKKRRLCGWAYTELRDALDRDGYHIEKTIAPMSFEETRETLAQLYEYFYTHLLSGNEADDRPEGISVSPVAGACTFCDFRPVCRFRGEERKAVPLTGAEGEEDED